MLIGPKKRRVRGAGILPVVLAVLALMMQVLTPAVVAAADSGDASRIVVLCTSEGEKVVTLPGDVGHKPFASYKCHDCVMAAVTAIPAPPADSLPIRHVAIVRHERAQAYRSVAPARPPPRPPSQGPPSLF